jgi:L-ascorbate metabolism protein UlaG (beta-lactamase superfamily)
MKIRWQGHACFYVIGERVRVVTDPYTASVAGLAPLREPADVVLMSSDDDLYHSHGAGVPGSPVIVNTLAVARDGGTTEVHGLRIDAIEAMESVVHKKAPDSNAMYRFTVDGVRVGHIGDVGNPFSPEQLAFFEGVDVLLALTGGPPTIELADLDAVLRHVQPRIVIPMHYRIPNLNLKIFGIDAFTTRFAPELVDVRDGAEIELTRDMLPPAGGAPRVVVLQPAANLQ